MSDVNDPPSIRIWTYRQAPAGLRARFLETCSEEGDEELLIHVPAELYQAGDGHIDHESAALNFINFPPKRDNHEQFAGDDFGVYRSVLLPDGGRIFVTRHSEWESR